MLLPKPTETFMNGLAARRAPEIELYQQLGFPDFFTDDEQSEPPMQTQSLSYGSPECEVMLKGGRVLGHPHVVTGAEIEAVEWDGVARPRTFREYRSHVQALTPLISMKSPLGRALQRFRPTKWDIEGAEWLRLVEWWALGRMQGERGLEQNVSQALRAMGARYDGWNLIPLRLAAELVSPGFAKHTLVAAGHWPPSRLGVSWARLEASFTFEQPDRYVAYCRATGEYIGHLYNLRLWRNRELREEELFAEEDRRTSWPLSGSGYVITGDGEVWRRDQKKRRWLRLGPPSEAFLIRPPKLERRRLG